MEENSDEQTSETDGRQARKARRTSDLWRLAIALLFAGIVASLALLVGLDAPWDREITVHQRATQLDLKTFAAEIVGYTRDHKALPSSLKQLTAGDVEILPRFSGEIRDGWGHPYVFDVRSAHVLIVSYGQDGKPGGNGLDADLTTDDPSPPNAGFTDFQFLTSPATTDMLLTVLATGLASGLLCFMLIRPAKYSKWNVARQAGELFVALLASAFLAVIITAFHVPSGH